MTRTKEEIKAVMVERLARILELDLTYRRGIKQAIWACDEDIQKEIFETNAKKILEALDIEFVDNDSGIQEKDIFEGTYKSDGFGCIAHAHSKDYIEEANKKLEAIKTIQRNNKPVINVDAIGEDNDR
jgi:hypothetical protein